MIVTRITKDGCIFFQELKINFGECWFYRGPAYWKNGYPIIRRHNKNWVASRFIWYILTGHDYFSKEVHHKCLSRSCVNFLHLEELTKRKHRKWHNSKL